MFGIRSLHLLLFIPFGSFIKAPHLSVRGLQLCRSCECKTSSGSNRNIECVGALRYYLCEVVFFPNTLGVTFLSFPPSAWFQCGRSVGDEIWNSLGWRRYCCFRHWGVQMWGVLLRHLELRFLLFTYRRDYDVVGVLVTKIWNSLNWRRYCTLRMEIEEGAEAEFWKFPIFWRIFCHVGFCLSTRSVFGYVASAITRFLVSDRRNCGGALR